MKKKIFFAILVMASCMSAHFAHALTQVTEQQAFLAVKNYRTAHGQADTIPFYSATITNIVNGFCCPIDTMPTAAWAISAQEKWLIFADEQPHTAWGHRCTYYYLPKQIEDNAELPIIHFQGISPPNGINFSSLNEPSNPLSYFMANLGQVSPGNNAPLFDPEIDGRDVRVIIYVDSPVGDDTTYRWNEVYAFYNILLNAGVPKSHIDVIGYLPNGDFDNDGLSDLSDWGFEERLNSFRAEPPSHLILYYAGPATPLLLTSDPTVNGDPTLCYWYIGEVQDVFSAINANYTSIILSCNDAYEFVPLLAANNRTVIGADEDFLTAGPDDMYYSFAYRWLSAMAGRDLITGTPVGSDLNNNGKVSMFEAYKYCYPNDNINETILYNSTPTQIGNGLYLTSMPTHTRFIIDQGLDAQHKISWNSPNIWIRAADDGLVNQESECVTVSTGSEVYIYTKIAVEGDGSYNGGKSLRLFWNYNHLGVPEYINDPLAVEWEDFDWDDVVPNHIADISLTQPYGPGDTIIVKYKWTVPPSVIEASAPLGGILSVNLGAMVTPSNFQLGDTHYTYDRLMVQKNLVTIDYTKLPVEIENVAPSQYNLVNDGKYRMWLYNNTHIHYSDSLALSVLADTVHSTGNAFPLVNMGLEVSTDMYSHGQPTLTNMTQDNLNPKRYRFLGTNSSMSNIFVEAGHNDTISFYVHGPYGFTAPVDQTFHLCAEAPSYSYGQAVRIILGDDNAGPGGPVIQSTPGTNNTYTLTETNINEPSRYEWFGTDLTNKITEGKSVNISAQDIGDVCVVKVTRLNDGKISYAMATLDGIPGIASVYPVPLDNELTIRLTSEALGGMSVRLMPLYGGSYIEQNFTSGQTELVLNTSTLPSGYYIVVLTHNGQQIQSVPVVK